MCNDRIPERSKYKGEPAHAESKDNTTRQCGQRAVQHGTDTGDQSDDLTGAHVLTQEGLDIPAQIKFFDQGGYQNGSQNREERNRVAKRDGQQ